MPSALLICLPTNCTEYRGGRAEQTLPPPVAHPTRDPTKRLPITHANHSVQKSRRVSAAQLFLPALCVSRNCCGCWDKFGFLNFCSI
ncbi:hypothetical protein CEXT_740351 [Caerostris extrusa]|uniref:Uncharacterized protein n=1 Tax=Caerostris extrusa TaxID=172846 RepID=A0AAV4SPJ0_CAEEX|nr:hypothetical protein CEXT_740351 [Caerostris extrusa]